MMSIGIAKILVVVLPFTFGACAPPRTTKESVGNPIREDRFSVSQFEKAVEEVVRVPPAAFQSLPPAITNSLVRLSCKIPQPAGETGLRNAIRGEFFDRGKSGWAVLCSVAGRTRLLVFRSDIDTAPEVLGEAEDKSHLQGQASGTIGYSREITTVGGEFIMRHYTNYGGPKPPAIDHHGIDDAFLGKASVTWYRHKGKWMGLQGAD